MQSSLFDAIGSQDEARGNTFISWIDSLEYFDSKAGDSLNPEELKQIQEEKQIFLNEIGFDENLLRIFKKLVLDFNERVVTQTTEEGIKSLIQETENTFNLENPTLKMDDLYTALDKYILEKNKQT